MSKDDTPHPWAIYGALTQLTREVRQRAALLADTAPEKST